MANKTRVALFDFCGTCVNFQTADEFIRFCTTSRIAEGKIRKQERFIHALGKARILRLYGLVFHASLQKRIIAKRVRGMTIEEVEEKANAFIDARIKTSIINETMGYFNDLKKDGVFCLFVSAAYRPYLQKFATQYGFDGVVCTTLRSRGGKMTGKIGTDCVGPRKEKMALRFLNSKFGKGNYEIVFSIADSEGDTRILDIARERVVISKRHQSWLKPDYKEVIYVHQGLSEKE